MSQKRSFYVPHDRSATWTENAYVDQHGEIIDPPSMTKQSFQAECDINNILKQYKASGQLAHINMQAAKGAYLDLPDDLDFQTALETVMKAEESFMTLPSKVRARFENDPEQFLMFMHDPKNLAEAQQLGLIPPPANPVTGPPKTGDASEASAPQPSPPAGK